MRVYIICPVRRLDKDTKEKLDNFVAKLEKKGIDVYLPYRDTDQTLSEVEINDMNINAIYKSDEVYVWYMKESTGSHFDLGVAVALEKPIRLINDIKRTDDKSYANYLLDINESSDEKREMKRWIDNASYEELLRKWRFAPLGDKYFSGNIGEYFTKKIIEKRNKLSSKEESEISKKVGWSE